MKRDSGPISGVRSCREPPCRPGLASVRRRPSIADVDGDAESLSGLGVWQYVSGRVGRWCRGSTLAIMRTVLICGAGVAGPTLAYWLARAGFRPTVVERADGQRSSGSPVDVRG